LFEDGASKDLALGLRALENWKRISVFAHLTPWQEELWFGGRCGILAARVGFGRGRTSNIGKENQRRFHGTAHFPSPFLFVSFLVFVFRRSFALRY
jgi:hypothetical protein